LSTRGILQIEQTTVFILFFYFFEVYAPPVPYNERKKESSQLIGRDRTLVFSLAWQVEHEN
jgi:hypothetical protein